MNENNFKIEGLESGLISKSELDYIVKFLESSFELHSTISQLPDFYQSTRQKNQALNLLTDITRKLKWFKEKQEEVSEGLDVGSEQAQKIMDFLEVLKGTNDSLLSEEGKKKFYDF